MEKINPSTSERVNATTAKNGLSPYLLCTIIFRL
jgi:hypothetical protein